MRIWLLKDGENLPVQQNVSQMRMWMLADCLTRRGHEVVWWASTHSHQRKALIANEDCNYRIEPGFNLRLIHAGSYQSNRSLKRLIHHWRLARRFREHAAREAKPDVIVTAFPIAGLSLAAIEHAKSIGAIGIVDVRDPWPDVIFRFANQPTKSLYKALLAPIEFQAKRCFKKADALFSCSTGFLDWALEKSGRPRCEKDAVFYIGRRSPKSLESSRLPENMLRLFERTRVVLFVGSFGHVYQLELVCEAAAKLSELRDRRLHFLLVGDGEKFASIKRRSESLDNVTVTGWVDHKLATEFMKRSAVGLAPCRQLPGCLPNKICEYASLGLPILSSLEGDAVGLLERYSAGLSYVPGDLNGFIEQLKVVAENSDLLDTMSQGATQLFEREFSADKIYESYSEAIENVANDRLD